MAPYLKVAVRSSGRCRRSRELLVRLTLGALAAAACPERSEGNGSDVRTILSESAAWPRRGRCSRERGPTSAASYKRWLGRTPLEVVRGEPGLAGDLRQHVWADLFVIVKGENEIRPPGTSERAMRAGLALQRPAEAQ